MKHAVTLFALTIAAQAAPTIFISTGIKANNAIQPLFFTWNTTLPIQGSGFTPNESVTLSLEGPINSLGVAPESIPLGTANADSQGAFSASPTIPYDQGVVGPQARIPRPGLYNVRASGPFSGAVLAANPINLAPATFIGPAGAIDWSHERGTRIGVLPGSLAAYSPERADPNWISVWDERPIGIYGTIVPGNANGDGSAARVSYEDDPITHYGHDTNFYLLPDPQYRWVVGTANYESNGEDESGVALGRIEVEWEALNNGNTSSYGTGQIGLPDWAIASSGDRMYVVGRWVLDAGHPEIGDRTELHPPRLVAVMRQRPAVSANNAAASQVDIYVSGHGGGANRYPSGMDALLDQGGHGGGRLRDVLSAADQQTYYQAGPLPSLELAIINVLIQALSGQSITGPIATRAGPSAFPWGTPAAEQQPVNDMDYDFDVPLPPAPAGATSVSVEVVTHPQHATGVTESITYGNGVAHIHLPFRGADDGIYARTLKFRWNDAPPPHHFRVTLNQITVNALPGKWHVWSDVAGQWTYLPALAPALLQNSQGQTIPTPSAAYDVYLRDTDTLRILVQGYHAQCIDNLFSTLFGMASYDAGIQLLEKCGPVNNDDLGGALLELPPLPSSQGTYTVKADAADQAGGGAFQVALTVEDLDQAQVPTECQGRTALSPSISSGGIVGAGLSIPRVMQVSPGGLVSIFGQNFAPTGTARGLTTADIATGQLPENLGCTCVEVNHRLAPVLFVSPTMINVQGPVDSGQNLSVQVVANCAAPSQSLSAAQTPPAQAVAPEFFFFKQNQSGANPIAATDAVTGALIGAPGLLSGALFTPARPGEYVALYATGLGPTNPPFAPGTLATGIARTVYPVTVSLNGNPLDPSDVLYAGIAPGYAGLYQINIRIPANAPKGDLSVSLTIDGVTTPSGAFITIE